jgi:hypothetical protein
MGLIVEGIVDGIITRQNKEKTKDVIRVYTIKWYVPNPLNPDERQVRSMEVDDFDFAKRKVNMDQQIRLEVYASQNTDDKGKTRIQFRAENVNNNANRETSPEKGRVKA